MKVRTFSLTAAAIATAFMVLHVPATSAQINNGTFVGTPQPRAQSPYRTTNPVQNTPILPMSNPIAPMGNPIAPIITPPFVRYSDGTPTVVIPNQSRGNHGNYGRGGRDAIYVPVGVPYYYQPYYEDHSVLEPAPVIPGQIPPLPNVSYRLQYPVAAESNGDAAAPASPAMRSAPEAQTEYYSEPRMIINEPRPDRVVVPPAIGTSRAEVIARFGKPWGTIAARGQETLYFDGVTVVFGADGRVVQTR